jgi:transposase InsO family protein
MCERICTLPRIVAAALAPGAVASEEAREAGIHTSQLFSWRQQLCKREPTATAFNAVSIAHEPAIAALPSPTSTSEQPGAVEIVSRDLDLWAYQRDVTLDFSRLGKPTDNAFIESFNGKFRAEWLNAHWFLSLDDARRKSEA